MSARLYQSCILLPALFPMYRTADIKYAYWCVYGMYNIRKRAFKLINRTILPVDGHLIRDNYRNTRNEIHNGATKLACPDTMIDFDRVLHFL